MALNQQVSDQLALLARLLELTGADAFRANAHARAARAVADLQTPIEELARDREVLLKLDGLGPKTADKVVELVTTGTLKELEELKAKVPAGLLGLMNIPGLGPKTVRAMWEHAYVTDAASLERAIADGSLARVPRLGAKAIEKIKANLSLAADGGKRVWLGLAEPLAQRTMGWLRKVEGVTRVEVAGSLRRGAETIGDIDILVIAKDAAGRAERAEDEAIPRVIEEFCALPGIERVLAKGPGKASVRMALDPDAGRWGKVAADAPTVQVDVRVVPDGSFGAAWMYFTGSKEHNVVLRGRAQRKGWTLNEYGLFPDDKLDGSPHRRGVKALAAREERDVYAALELAWIPPELREGIAESDWSRISRPIEVGDLKAELHAHTTASDGRMTLRELVEHAARRGFGAIAVTDHSRSSAIAGGLTAERLREQIVQIRELDQEIRESKPGQWGREQARGIRVLAGSEVDILADGRLDYDDELLAELDVVVASPHAALTQDAATATARMVQAASHPLVHIVGHPTGRLLQKRQGLPLDIVAVAEAAAAAGTALEVNAHWMRLDLRDIHVRTALARGAQIAINCDVHERIDSDNVRFGVATARRGGLTPERCINALEIGALLTWLDRKGPRRRA